MKFNVIDNGNSIICNILFTFRDDINDVNYIVYTDGSIDNNNEEVIYASRYIKEENNFILKPIESEYEWNLIDNMIESKCKKG